MVSFEDAVNVVLSQTFKNVSEPVALDESLGRILAGDVFSDLDMPPFDKSAVDGFACQAKDLLPIAGDRQNTATQHFVLLRLIETIAAGTVPQKTIHPGECSKIMTGAMMPPGADCVIMVEDSEMQDDGLVRILPGIKGTNICYRAEDVKTGDKVLQEGLRITPAHVAVMAGVGMTTPLVAKLPRVSILSTGNELVEPSVIPGLSQIRNSNASQLHAQVLAVPARPSCHGIVADEGPDLRKAIDYAMAHSDLVLITGGVSMGDFDFVPAVMQDAGIDILFKSVAVQPGKPTVFGCRDNTYIFGLPGNPVSSFVIFEMMVKPFLLKMMGNDHHPVEITLPMGTRYSRRRSERKSFIPVRISNGEIFPVEYHGSAHINAYTAADAVLVMEIGTTVFNLGDPAHVRLL